MGEHQESQTPSTVGKGDYVKLAENLVYRTPYKKSFSDIRKLRIARLAREHKERMAIIRATRTP